MDRTLTELIESASAAASASAPDRIAALKTTITQSGADPREIETAAEDAFNTAYSDGQFSVDDAPRLDALIDIVEAARAVADEQDQVRSDLRGRAAALKKRKNNDAADNGENEDSTSDVTDNEPSADGQGPQGTEGTAGSRGRGEGGGAGGERIGEERGSRDDDSGDERDRSGRRRDSRGRFEPDDGDDERGGSGGRTSEGSGDSELTDNDDENDGEAVRKGNDNRDGTAHSSSRRRVTLSAEELNAQRDQPIPESRPVRSFTITASADTPDAQMGSQLSMRDLAEAARTRMRSMPVGTPVEAEVRRPIAQINRVVDDKFVVDGANPVKDAEQVDWIADEKRLPGGSLVAAAKQQHDAMTASAGGMQAFATPPGDIWCSPSETDYSLCPALATRTGLVDLPSFQVRRGGIRYPVWKQYPEQHRPLEHGPGDKEIANDQAQGWYPSHNPPEDYPYDAQYVSDGPRHDWHGYAHTNRNTIGSRPDLEDPDYFIKNPKKHIQGPCVEWAEERMHMAYLWIEEDILRNHTYPELAERFMSDSLVSHAHFMNETYIRWIASHSDRLDPFWAGTPGWGGPGEPPRNGVVPPGPMSYPLPVATNNYYPGSHLDFGSYGLYGMGSAAEAVLERVGWLVTWFRNTYRMGWDSTLEGIAPYWFREFLKLDVERKINRPHNFRVSNQDVENAFLVWGCRMQWVYDWQDMPSTEYSPPYDEVLSSHIMPRGGWPNAVDIILYPSGSWVLAEQNIIRLEATYDSNRLRNNKFTALYAEDAWMLLNRCNRSFVIQLRGLCANGATGMPWEACSPEAVPARREQIAAADGGKRQPPQMLDGLGNNKPSTGGGKDSGGGEKPPAGGDGGGEGKDPGSEKPPPGGNGNGRGKKTS